MLDRQELASVTQTQLPFISKEAVAFAWYLTKSSLYLKFELESWKLDGWKG